MFVIPESIIRDLVNQHCKDLRDEAAKERMARSAIGAASLNSRQNEAEQAASSGSRNFLFRFRYLWSGVFRRFIFNTDPRLPVG